MDLKLKILTIMVATSFVVHRVQAGSIKFQNCVDFYSDHQYVFNISSDYCGENLCYFPINVTGNMKFDYKISFEAPIASQKICSIVTITDSDIFYSDHELFLGKYAVGEKYTLDHFFYITYFGFEHFGSNKLVDVFITYRGHDASYNMACVRFQGYIYNSTECTDNAVVELLDEIDKKLDEAEKLRYHIVSYFFRYLEKKVKWLKALKQKIIPIRNEDYPIYCKSYIELRGLFESFSSSSFDIIDTLSRNISSHENLSALIEYTDQTIKRVEKKIETTKERDNYQELEFLENSLEQLKSLNDLIKNAQPGEKIEFYIEVMFLLIESVQNGSL